VGQAGGIESKLATRFNQITRAKRVIRRAGNCK
jgi:hypothetical protein